MTKKFNVSRLLATAITWVGISFYGITYAAQLPLDFSAKPNFPIYKQSGQLPFTLINNTPVTLPLNIPNLAFLTRDNSVPNNCGSSLASKQTCQLTYTYNFPIPTSVSEDLVINYDGRYPLTDHIQIVPSPIEVDNTQTDDYVTAYADSPGAHSTQNSVNDDFVSTGKVTLKNLTSSVITGLGALSPDPAVTFTGGSCMSGSIPANGSCEYIYTYKPLELATQKKLKNGHPLARGKNTDLTFTLNGQEATDTEIQTVAFDQGRFIALPYNKSSYRDFPADEVIATYVDPATKNVIAATPVGLAESTTDENSWRTYTTGNGLGMHYVWDAFSEGDTILAATEGGLSTSLDKGANWTNHNTNNGLGSDQVLGTFAVGDTFYAATSNGLAVSLNKGLNWVNHVHTAAPDSIADSFVNKVFSAAGKIYAATNNGVSISSNNGATWTNPAALAGKVIWGIFASGNNVYAATYNNGLYISRDGGTSWLEHYTNPTTPNFGSTIVSSVYAVGNNIYAATANGLSISTDNGASWTNYTTTNGLGSNLISDVFVDSENNIFAATVGGGLNKSDNGGTTWTKYNPATSKALGEEKVLSVFELGNKILAGTDKDGLFVSNDGGQTFTERTNLPANIIADVHIKNGEILAATFNSGTGVGSLSKSPDDGLTWTNYTTPNLGSNFVKGVFSINSYLYAATQPFGANPGGLSLSPDNGSSWSNIVWTGNNLGIASNVVNNLDTSDNNQDIYVATAPNLLAPLQIGGVSISNDYGAHWVTRTIADGLGSNITNNIDTEGNDVYVATSTNALDPINQPGGVSISTDNGTTFNNHTVANSGIISNNVSDVVADDSGDIVAATDSGVSESTDNGSTFTNYTTEDGLSGNETYQVTEEKRPEINEKTVVAGTRGGANESVRRLEEPNNK
ncbi:MAG: exo-alpha-sialidase [Gammaproteobacteria bacterium]|nr:exo-alpha-sialidase [Gammaproteobacteria bacterium]